jgi:hypothetical protein
VILVRKEEDVVSSGDDGSVDVAAAAARTNPAVKTVLPTSVLAPNIKNVGCLGVNADVKTDAVENEEANTLCVTEHHRWIVIFVWKGHS